MRAGLTGLGLVFVATMAASVLFAPAEQTKPKEPSEPLAQLGVAPGPEKNGAAALAARIEQPASDLPMIVAPSTPPPEPAPDAVAPLPQSAPPAPDPALRPAPAPSGQRPLV